jgi:hypothetical protein
MSEHTVSPLRVQSPLKAVDVIDAPTSPTGSRRSGAYTESFSLLPRSLAVMSAPALEVHQHKVSAARCFARDWVAHGVTLQRGEGYSAHNKVRSWHDEPAYL